MEETVLRSLVELQQYRVRLVDFLDYGTQSTSTLHSKHVDLNYYFIMSLVIGIDGCKSGWFVVWEESDTGLQSCVIPKLTNLHEITNKFDRLTVGIDMPVVLSASIPREADQLARRQLGKKASSIFSAPTPEMLKQESYADVRRFSQIQFGKSVSIQSWNLFPKIRDVQNALDMEQLDLFEIHPELSFKALNNGNVILESKKTLEGFLVRKLLLENAFATFVFETIRAQYLKKDVANDDILDALVVLWSAKRVTSGQARFLPEHPNKPNMRIAY